MPILQMNQPLSYPSKLRSFLKGIIISLIVIAAIWLAVIFWWQTTRRIITLKDVLVYLVCLPAFTLIGIGLLRLRSDRKKQPVLGGKRPAPSTSALSSSANSENTERPETAYATPVLAAWAITSAGDNPSDFAAVLKERRIRPRPDAYIRDEQGFPAMSSRITPLDIESVQDDLRHTIARHASASALAMDEARDAFLRTMALLSRLLDQISSDWPLEEDIDSALPDKHAQATLRGSMPAVQQAAKRIHLEIKFIVPAAFQPDEQELARLYLLDRLAAFPLAAERIRIEVIPSYDAAAAFVLLDQFNSHTHKAAEAKALLLLACESTLCQTVADDWQATGKIFSAKNPGGLMMGEAAFGMLCISDAGLFAALSPPVCGISRIGNAIREVSADSAGKPSSSALSEATRSALAFSGVQAEQIGTVACDADHRTNRILECIGMMLEITPSLDAIGHRLATNEACGHTGTASALGSLVAGIAQVHHDGRPVLAFNVSHMFERAAAVLIPATELPQIS